MIRSLGIGALVLFACTGARAEDSKIYALFLCSADGICRIYGESHIGARGAIVDSPFQTLAACRHQAYINSGGLPRGPDGRTRLPDGSWWECRAKRIDTWQAPQ
jgi:hypothetical protein